MVPRGYAAAGPHRPNTKGMNARSRQQARCDRCGTDLITISLQDGAIRFTSCVSCEVSVWERGGSVVSRAAVIADIPRR
jgi:hypothetical protein